MSTFIKICPKCGHHNPEYDNACGVCTYFIGMETPVSAPPSAPSAQPSVDAGEAEVRSADAPEAPTAEARVASQTSSQAILYLQVLGTDRVFEVRDGWTVGQTHPSSTADLQLRDLPGIKYVHRNHCRFSWSGGNWVVTPTDQREFGRDFTNPTAVNQTTVTPGEAHPLKNGDQLSLANLKVVVRII
jgi:pSer/pThr/pTyr-binding forkhead associated (FHA) protein